MKLLKAIVSIICFNAALGILLYTILFNPDNIASVISWIITLFCIYILLSKGIKKFILYGILFYFLSIVLHFENEAVIQGAHNLNELIIESFKRLFIRGL